MAASPTPLPLPGDVVRHPKTGEALRVVSLWTEFLAAVDASGKTFSIRYSDLTNVATTNGLDRCWCGCKYWIGDRCIDCGSPLSGLVLS